MKKVKLLSVVAVGALCGAFAAAQADVNARVYVKDPGRPDQGCFLIINATLLPNGSPLTITFATLIPGDPCQLVTLYSTI
ncbi:hypothetical protein [Chitinophaga sp. HK235]|uniref:hypothetical protein n=1 Tax=Chitinophaga sp. HK235 TaxID=2952571 RepID=UPI001BA763CA|nr:hypothetical protein [Chitinophaga sp. HK235]